MTKFTKTQADFWQAAITEALAGRNLVTVATRPSGRGPDVRVEQSFKDTYLVDYGNGAYGVGVSDSYGTICCDEYRIDPNQRSIVGRDTNGYGEELWFVWRLANDDESAYGVFHRLQKASWVVK